MVHTKETVYSVIGDSGKSGSELQSAAMRGLKKSVHIKTDAMKEMEAWANDGHEGQKLVRNSGQLPDNVTEERMLHTRLWELSKERYKFLSQAEYEKKMFLERQQRKSAAMKEIIAHIQVTGLGRRAKPSAKGGTPTGKKPPAKKVTPRSAKIERGHLMNKDPCPRPSSTPGWTGGQQSTEVPHEPTSPLTKSTPVFATEPTVFKKNGGQRRVQIITKSDNAEQQPQQEKLPFIGSDSPSAPVRFVSTPARHSSAQTKAPDTSSASNTAPRKGFKTSTKSILKWTSSKPKSKAGPAEVAKQGPMADPRYTHFRSSLSEKYNPKNVELKDVPLIIKTMECLHKPPKIIKDTKPKMTMKIKEFMTDHGIEF